ncbi:hypothetical protein [Streptomyces sp. Je 1-369]|uniref:hypothetical protein n=1 Tax=Streptomyces sp. Je 1-369 TaxID=2966192 RepID=UPI002285A026|nr:hypothetical protein [Streptomyces sp. Je 1-369]WAL93641.1 hypothetical protein NOO62_03525 [Streptomyces sp. Je 1-369]
MKDRVGNVTRERYEQLVSQAKDLIAQVARAQFSLGDMALEIQPMRPVGGSMPNGTDDLFTVSESLQIFADDIGVQRSTVEDWRYTANRWPKDKRKVARLLTAVAELRGRGPHLEAFFGCMYYAAMRPAEVIHLRLEQCHLPETGWGMLNLAHIERFGVAPDGRLFRNQAGSYVDAAAYGTTWARARKCVLTRTELASGLAKRPYDLRHAGISFWLYSGVDPAECARRAGQSIEVLFRHYAKFLDGVREQANRLIEQSMAEWDRVSQGGASAG